MINHEFRAIVVDLFDTLVKWEPERLPLIEINGRAFRSTMPWIFPKLEQRLGTGFDRDRFTNIYTAVMEEIALERQRDGIEITCSERFARTLAKINRVPSHQAASFAEELTRIHMNQVRAVTTAPAQ